MVDFRAVGAIVIACTTAVEAAAIKYDEVEPFAEPEPTTISDKAAVKFKPQLRITGECHSYAVVNAAGETSAGLEHKLSGSGASGCRGFGVDTQVYGRSTWYNDMWAIMYA